MAVKMQDLITIGEIANIHGVRGEIKVLPLTDDPKRFKKLKRVFIVKPKANTKKTETSNTRFSDRSSLAKKNSDEEADPSLLELEIESVKFIKKFVILKLYGVDDTDEAQSLKRALIKIERKDAVKLPENTYFIFDLVGISVYDEQGIFIGQITDVLQTGSNDCYNIRRDDGFEFYIPALKDVILKVDIESQKMSVKLPKGLLDDK